MPIGALDKKIRKAVEPLGTQEFIHERFGAQPGIRAWSRHERMQARKQLKKLPGGEAADFRRDNPDADIYDYERYQESKKK